MFESFQSVVFPANAQAGDNQYVPFQLPDTQQPIELAAWGNYPAYKGIYLFEGRPPVTSIASVLAGETAGDILLALGNQIMGKRLLPDNVRGVTAYLESAVGGTGALVVMIRLRSIGA